MYFLTIFLALVTSSFAVESKELDYIPIGGQNVSIADYPFQASITDSSVRLCGAIIVSPLAVITTANCVRVRGSGTLRVRVGTPSRMYNGDQYKVKNYVFNPKLQTGKQWLYDLDIAVVHLLTPIVFKDTVQPIALPEEEDLQANVAYLLGWEWKGPTKNTVEDENFQKLRLAIVDRALCAEIYKNNFTVTENMICAGGSPTSVLRHHNGLGGALINNKKELVGILSYTDKNHALGFPYVFTRITSLDVQEYIKQHISL